MKNGKQRSVINTEDVRKVIAYFKSGKARSFTSHEFIEKFREQCGELYLKLLQKHKERKNTAHAEIANYLRYHDMELQIEKDKKPVKTPNINGNISVCKVWNIKKQ